MRSSKVYNKKHTHLFQCEDQNSQNNKKSNNFVIREVPIKKLFNGDHCTDNNFVKGKNYSIDYDMPELVVFIQEDHHQQQQYVKDICIDREGERKCDMNRKSDLNLGIMETMSNNSLSECSSQQFSFKEAMKVHGFRNLMKSEMELDLGNKISNDLHLTKKTAETLREAFKRERNISRCVENLQRNSFLGTSGSKVEFPHSTDSVQVTDTNFYRPDISYLQSLTASSRERQVDYPQETLSGPHSCIGHANTFSIASHKSNDSIGSSNSFAFPILPAEWNGSPVRMMEANKNRSRKHRWRKMLMPCCDFDDQNFAV
ncbi:uncharacterized protein LOC123909865 [Trifolium pratense]|uniref:uncharacterized protein LOC123909865 n=1 Tax=Trifolium pratense TaxID=57577 RepID=UPI001E695314|nr:uncharacterized protein LOC123909865 [Trifolium pratense]